MPVVVSSSHASRVIQKFILNSPSGEQAEVVADLQKLAGNAKNASEAIATGSRANMLAVYQTVTHNNQKFLVTPFAQISEGKYLNPATNKVHTVDPLTKEVTHSRDLSQSEAAALNNSQQVKYRQILDQSAQSYVERFYVSAVQCTYSVSKAPNKYVTCICAQITNARSFWSGSWRSTWEFEIAQRKVEIRGKVVILTHLYEEGNVQLKIEGSLQQTVDMVEPLALLGEACFHAIETMETNVYQNMEKHFETMGQTTYKALRRSLPVTASLMDWENARSLGNAPNKSEGKA